MIQLLLLRRLPGRTGPCLRGRLLGSFELAQALAAAGDADQGPPSFGPDLEQQAIARQVRESLEEPETTPAG